MNKKESTKIKEYVNERMALIFEQNGASPLVGRIFSRLIFSTEPVSLQDLADKLGVTKAAISVQVRSLNQAGLCRKLAKTRDRRDYYQISDDFVHNILQSHTRSMIEFNSFIKDVIDQFPDLDDMADGEKEVYQTALRRFREIQSLHELLFERLEGLEEEWEIRKKNLIHND